MITTLDKTKWQKISDRLHDRCRHPCFVCSAFGFDLLLERAVNHVREHARRVVFDVLVGYSIFCGWELDYSGDYTGCNFLMRRMKDFSSVQKVSMIQTIWTVRPRTRAGHVIQVCRCHDRFHATKPFRRGQNEEERFSGGFHYKNMESRPTTIQEHAVRDLYHGFQGSRRVGEDMLNERSRRP